jgi:hypothetical protein|eukprot:COSAG01_NODE_1777_length_9258_cov_7.865284_7_plen_88_part_00
MVLKGAQPSADVEKVNATVKSMQQAAMGQCAYSLVQRSLSWVRRLSNSVFDKRWCCDGRGWSDTARTAHAGKKAIMDPAPVVHGRTT